MLIPFVILAAAAASSMQVYALYHRAEPFKGQRFANPFYLLNQVCIQTSSVM